MTFSLLGRCDQTGRLGIVISSSSPAVAARCAHVRPRVGVAASQNVTDPRLGPALLDALRRRGGDARAAVDEVVAGHEHAEHRQLVLLGVTGEAAVHAGAAALGTHGARVGPGCVAAGNLLAGDEVLDAMIEVFVSSAGEDLADRLMAGLRAAIDAGGEAGPVHSAGLLMTGDVEWPIADLRVDWHDDPVSELEAAWAVYRPQLQDYVIRALDPTAAPGYGVPGE
ncbi:MAG TPA: DUF1028 domain-containing protein [Solirubrobacteraceae bacterium]|nr:DUF1028 domain-containing protein [Solirubrobacteraceae bacterium]